jgi:RimJ/RimL family protein N-acetyltransferase
VRSAPNDKVIATPELHSRRLVLEVLSPAHSDSAFAGFADPDLYRFMSGEPPASADALRAEFARLAAGSGRDDELWLNWLAFRREDRALAGWHQATLTVPTATIAWVTFPAFRRSGYAREGAAAVIAWLATQGVGEIVAQSDERNAGSRRTAEALGFLPDPAPIAETLRGESTFDRVYRLWKGTPR